MNRASRGRTLLAGDLDGYVVFKRVVKAVGELLAKDLPE